MNRWLVLPVALPLAAAAIAVALPRGVVQRLVSFATTSAVLVFAAMLLASTAGGEVLAVQVGGWPPRFAIPLVADPFSALMLTGGALMVVVCTAFAAARGEDGHPFFHPLALVLTAGISGAFLTADLFNLFVFFEVMLVASYVLLTLGRTREEVRAGAVYITTNLLASTMLIVGVALTYGIAGTVNMAELAEGSHSGSLLVAGGVLLVAFGVKGSLVPLHGWLPRVYPATSPAVAALFSALLTKVGVYALYRVYSVVFGGDPALRTLLLVIASATMVVGVLGAVGRDEMREILSFHTASQVGYMVMGLGLFGPLGLAGGIFFILHHMVVKTSLFLAAGAVETFEGTGVLHRLGGVGRRRWVLALAFVLAAFSLAGLPPFSGFFAKLLLVRAALEQADYGVAAVAVAVSFLTLLSMVKIWNGVFWGEIPEPARVPPPMALPRPFGVVAPAAVLAAISLGLGIGAQGLLMLTSSAAGVLIDPTPYVRAVLGS